MEQTGRFSAFSSRWLAAAAVLMLATACGSGSNGNVGGSGGGSATSSGKGTSQATSSSSDTGAGTTTSTGVGTGTGSSTGVGTGTGTSTSTGSGPTCSDTCFGTATWVIDNLSPCYFTTNDGMGNSTTVAVSTIVNGGTAACPTSATAPPVEPWSTDHLTAACTGTYDLCYTLKAGDWHTPQATDCTVTTVCTQATYGTQGVSQDFPPLPGWLSDAAAGPCVLQFMNQGGYGLRSVTGTAPCGSVDKQVGNVVAYCPIACSQPNPPAMCATCMMP